MQLFHELKQKFPDVPDHAVSGAISSCRHDRAACLRRLRRLQDEARAALTRAYRASSSSSAARLPRERRPSAPGACPNRPQALDSVLTDEASNEPIIGAKNEAIIEAIATTPIETKAATPVEAINPQVRKHRNDRGDASPITINIDSCIARIGETPSDVESDDPSRERTEVTHANEPKPIENTENTSYSLLKSSKVRSNLNVQLENQEVTKEKISTEKPKRPCTLEFAKPQSEISNLKQKIPEPVSEPCRTISPAPPKQEPANQQQGPEQDQTPRSAQLHWSDQPINLSVNVNCHMDVPSSRRSAYQDCWVEDHDSPRHVTSVNLTVCTPTSAMQSPLKETGGYPTSPECTRGFEGHVTVTVSPSAIRPPRRRAPPPPGAPVPSSQQGFQPEQRFLPTSVLEEPLTATDMLIARQRARKKVLDNELARERSRLAQLSRETAILATPLPSPADARRLKEYVERLRDQCHMMTRKLDRQLPVGGHTHAEQDSNEFYNSAYSQQRPPATVPTRPAPPVPSLQPEEAPSWQCHVCTFRNHGLLNKCEECDMPRIVVVRAGDGEITVRLMPGRRKMVRSWLL